MIKLFGILDISAAVFLWLSVLFPIPEIILGLFGVYLLAKGLVFVGFGLDILSLIDLIAGFIIIASVSIVIHPMVISIVSIYLVGKGIMSLL